MMHMHDLFKMSIMVGFLMIELEKRSHDNCFQKKSYFNSFLLELKKRWLA